MKFLEKFVDNINAAIEKLIEKVLHLIPQTFFDKIEKLKHLPEMLKLLLMASIGKIRIFFLKFIGYIQHYITLVRGQFTEFMIYTRSDEFKHDKKKALVTRPIEFIKNNPVKFLSALSVIAISISSFILIGKNTSTIIIGTRTRSPASSTQAEVIDESIFQIKHHKFEVIIGGGAAGGHGGAAAHEEEEVLVADLNLKLVSEHKKEMLEDMEEMIDDFLESIEIKVSALPISPEEQSKIEATIVKELNEGLEIFNHEAPIVSASLVFHQHSRPDYYRKSDRSFALKNVDLQVFEEDLKRNHQVYLDFTVVGSNRNVILFLKDHELLIRDRFSTNVEPILPHLPIEDEGRRIIKDKIRDELNEILKKENVEGKVIEVFLDYSMSS